MLFKQCALALVAVLGPVTCSAEISQVGRPPSKSPLTAQFVKTGLFVISGGGCNSVLRLTQNGFILVDGQLPGNYDALMKKVQKISFSDQLVQALILPDYHENTVGTTPDSLS